MQIIDSFGISLSCTYMVNCLPKLQGAGLVRDMREAMSLTDAQGNLITIASSLQTQVQAFASAQMAQEHQGMRDGLIGVWDKRQNKPINTINSIALCAGFMPAKCLKRFKNRCQHIQKLFIRRINSSHHLLERRSGESKVRLMLLNRATIRAEG